MTVEIKKYTKLTADEKFIAKRWLKQNGWYNKKVNHQCLDYYFYDGVLNRVEYMGAGRLCVGWL
jgi:hypothetical protein